MERLHSRTHKRDQVIRKLEGKARQIRKMIIEMIVSARSGHLMSSLSPVEIMVALYYYIMSPKDIFILSKGHAAPALYSILIDKGVIPKEMLHKLRKIDGLEGHPRMNIPGIESPSGSLGIGLAVAAGRALGKKLKGEDGYVYVLVGDGELQEGICWEVFQFANARNLDNLFVIVDRNGLQLSGPTELINPMEPLDMRLKAFGFWTRTIDGHNFEEIIDAIERGKRIQRPKAIIAHTLKGKGIQELEWNVNGHLMKISEIEEMIRRYWEE